MIFPTSIGNFISFLAYFFITILTYLSYRRRKIAFTSYFLGAFIAFSIFSFFISFPGYVFNTPISAGLVFLSSYFWTYIIAGILAFISFRIIDKPKLGNIALFCLLALLIFSIYIGIINFKPASFVSVGNLNYWIPNVEPIIRIIIGSMSAICGFIFIVFILVSARKSKQRKILNRALLLGGGALFVVLASAINYLIGAVPSAQTFFISPIACIISASLFLAGVLYKIE